MLKDDCYFHNVQSLKPEGTTRYPLFVGAAVFFISYNFLQFLRCEIQKNLYFTLLFSPPRLDVGNVGGK
nr:MAG TPA: hypothetical protein [Caudoviricetes sp.]